jgi:hypothetical protein
MHTQMKAEEKSSLYLYHKYGIYGLNARRSHGDTVLYYLSVLPAACCLLHVSVCYARHSVAAGVKAPLWRRCCSGRPDSCSSCGGGACTTIFHGLNGGCRRSEPFATLSETSYFVGMTNRGGRRFRIVASFSCRSVADAPRRRLRRSRHLGRACAAQRPSPSIASQPKEDASRLPARSSSSAPSLTLRMDITTGQTIALGGLGEAIAVVGGTGTGIGAQSENTAGGEPITETGGDGVFRDPRPPPTLSTLCSSWLHCSSSVSLSMFRPSGPLSAPLTGLCCTRQRSAAMALWYRACHAVVLRFL